MFVLIILYVSFVAFSYYAYSSGESAWIMTNGARILMLLLGLLTLIAGVIQTVVYCR